jgi:hypothetical protein
VKANQKSHPANTGWLFLIKFSLVCACTHINCDGHRASVASGKRGAAILRSIISQTILALSAASRKAGAAASSICEFDLGLPSWRAMTFNHMFAVNLRPVIDTGQIGRVKNLKRNTIINKDILVGAFFNTIPIRRHSVCYSRRSA